LQAGRSCQDCRQIEATSRCDQSPIPALRRRPRGVDAGTLDEGWLALLHLALPTRKITVAPAQATLALAIQAAMDVLADACAALRGDALPPRHAKPTPVRIPKGPKPASVAARSEIHIPSCLVHARVAGSAGGRDRAVRSRVCCSLLHRLLSAGGRDRAVCSRVCCSLLHRLLRASELLLEGANVLRRHTGLQRLPLTLRTGCAEHNKNASTPEEARHRWNLVLDP